MSFCLCLDMDGFYVGNKFLVREIGWYAPLPNGQEAYGVHRDYFMVGECVRFLFTSCCFSETVA